MFYQPDPVTMRGHSRQKKRFLDLGVNQHYQRNADIFFGYNQLEFQR